jgi:hypothetical protein
MCTDVVPFTNVVTLTAPSAVGFVVHIAYATANIAVVGDPCSDYLGSRLYINGLQKGIKKGHIWG